MTCNVTKIVSISMMASTRILLCFRIIIRVTQKSSYRFSMLKHNQCHFHNHLTLHEIAEQKISRFSEGIILHVVLKKSSLLL
jgi:hypothetical protein